MAKSHARSYRENGSVQLVACCDVVESKLRTFAEEWDIPAVYTDFREMIEKEDLDGISNVTPDSQHAPVSIYAMQKGIAVLCEKPMASSLEEAEEMRRTAGENGVIGMVNYSKRSSSGLQYARELIRKGGIGRIMHVEASYLQSWLVTDEWGDWRVDPRFTWRLSTAHGSSGTLGDIGCHIYDMAAFLCGDITDLYCRVETYDKGIPAGRIGEYVLDANDSMIAAVTFVGGAIGTIHATRWATGYINREFVRVYGDRGTVEVDFDKSKTTYQFFSAETRSWQTVECDATPSNYDRFVTALQTGRKDESDFENGYRVQKYLHYSVISDREKRSIRIE